jgi:hypothetical protein
MFDVGEELALVEDGVDTLFGDDACFVHLLHCVGLAGFLEDNTPYFTESTFADGVLEFEVVAGDLGFGGIEFDGGLDDYFVLFLWFS